MGSPCKDKGSFVLSKFESVLLFEVRGYIRKKQSFVWGNMHDLAKYSRGWISIHIKGRCASPFELQALHKIDNKGLA